MDTLEKQEAELEEVIKKYWPDYKIGATRKLFENDPICLSIIDVIEEHAFRSEALKRTAMAANISNSVYCRREADRLSHRVPLLIEGLMRADAYRKAKERAIPMIYPEDEIIKGN